MSDPAIEAAQRAWNAISKGAGTWTVHPGGLGERLAFSAAIEMAKPIRELHKPEVVRSPDDEQWTECTSCYGAHWPCETAKLIYTTEEL